MMLRGLNIWLLFLVFLAVPSVVALPGSWLTYQKDGASTGVQDGSSNIVNAPINEFFHLMSANSFQPLIEDIDLDGKQDVIIFSGSHLRIFDQYMQLKAEFAIGALLGQPSLAQYDSDQFIEIVGVISVNGSNTYVVVEYTGGVGGFSVQQQISLGNDKGNLKCVDFSGDGYDDCLLRDANGVLRGFNQNGQFFSLDVSGGTGVDSVFAILSFSDIDRDGIIDGVIAQHNIVSMFDRNGIKWQKDTGLPFSPWYDIALTNPQGENGTIVLVSHQTDPFCYLSGPGCVNHLLSYDASGNLMWSYTFGSTYYCGPGGNCGTASPMTPPMIYQGNKIGIAANFVTFFNNQWYTNLYYYDTNGSLLESNSASNLLVIGSNGYADFDGDQLPDFIDGNGIFSHYGNLILGNDFSGRAVPVDVDQDGIFEVITTQSPYTKITHFKNISAPSNYTPPSGPNNIWFNPARDEKGSAFQFGGSSFHNTSINTLSTGEGDNNFWPLVGDLDAAGAPEIVIFANSNISIYDEFLNKRASIQVGSPVAHPAIVQYDTDPYLEIAGVWNQGSNNNYQIYQFDGTSFTLEQDIDISSQTAPFSQLQCADLDNDGKVECFLKESNGFMRAYNINGQVFNVDVSGGSGVDTGTVLPVFEDINLDGYLDGVILHNNILTLFDRNGIKWQRDVSGFMNGYSWSRLTFANLDGGYKEIVVAIDNGAGGSASYLLTYLANGDVYWNVPLGWSTTSPGNFYYYASPLSFPLIYDIDKDGFDEIGMRWASGTKFWTGIDTTSTNIGFFDYNGAIVSSASSGSYLQNSNSNTFPFSTSADMDGDGVSDWITKQRIISSNGTTMYELAGLNVVPVPVDLGGGVFVTYSFTIWSDKSV